MLINEVMSANQTALLDENGDSSDWLELYNAGRTEVNLAGWALSDSTNAWKWSFNSGVIAPRGFLLAFASGKNRQPLSIAAEPPTHFSGLNLWLRADAVETTDPTQVRVSGNNLYVKKWNDQSGSSNHAQQSTDIYQPLLIAAAPGLGNQPAIRFDGANDLLLLSSVAAQNNFTLIVVARSFVSHEVDAQDAVGVGGVSGQRYLFGARHGGDYQAGAGLSFGTNGVTVYEHGSGYMPALAVAATSLPGFAVLTVNYSNRQPSLYVQGNQVSSGFTSARTNVSAPIEIGSGAYGAFQGDLAEVLLYNRSLPDPERAAIEQYLSGKYGIGFPRFYHTNFRIASEGERLTLTRPDGSLADAWPAVAIPPGTSYGRQPDGETNRLFFELATPGGSNVTPGATELLQPPQFSVTRGFFTNSFPLALNVTNLGATIRYTLDGSEPATNSPIYTGPITVRSRAGQANSLSTIPTGGGWQAPAGEVFKLTVVRAKAFKPGAVASGAKTHSYLVAPVSNRYSLPVISIATDRKNLVDPNVGIYVPGNAAGGNYFQRGPAWERPIHIEFFERDGVAAFAQNAGIKIHGNTSRQFPIKGVDIIGDYANEGPLQYRFFTNRTQTSWPHILLRQSGHDYFLTYFRDALMHDLAEDFAADTMASRPAIVFYNGEYWGIHNIREKEDKYFLEGHSGADPNNLDYLEGYAAPVEGDTAHYNAMLAYLGTHDMRQATNYAWLQTQMEVGNYIDYKVAEIWTYRWDIGNHRLWRPRTPEGRWRWLQFDNDVGWGGFWAVPPAWEFNFLAYDTEPNGPWIQYEQSPGGNDHNSPVTTFLLRKLLENDTFKRAFINRFADLLNTTYRPSNTLERIDRFAARIAPEMKEHLARWQAPASLSVWSNNVAYLRTYATSRGPFCRQQITNKFGLRGTVNLSLQVSHTNHGSIRINTVDIAAPTNAPWTGVYFRDNPVTITAQPRPGYRFAGWDGIFAPTNSLTLALSGDLTLTARFEILPVTNTPVPAPFDLATGPYLFQRWEVGAAGGTYPPNMIFLQTATNAAADPALSSEFTNLWTLPYNLASRSRINGLGEEGVAFLNTSDPQADGGGYVGAAVLALNTLGKNDVQVSWRGGTVTPNSRAYAIRLQYRVGTTSPFVDLPGPGGHTMEYVRNAVAGHSQFLGPTTLPAEAAHQPYVQLRWKYYWLSGNNGARDQLRLDDITVSEPVAPPRATSLTLDGSGGVRLQCLGAPLFTYTVETSTNLVDWVSLSPAIADAAGHFELREANASKVPARFYRLRWP